MTAGAGGEPRSADALEGTGAVAHDPPDVQWWQEDDGSWGCRVDCGDDGIAFGVGATKWGAFFDAANGVDALFDGGLSGTPGDARPRVHVIACHGCRRKWVVDEDDPATADSCACTCKEGDERYEEWREVDSSSAAALVDPPDGMALAHVADLVATLDADGRGVASYLIERAYIDPEAPLHAARTADAAGGSGDTAPPAACVICGDDQSEIDTEPGSPTFSQCVVCQPCPKCGVVGGDCTLGQLEVGGVCYGAAGDTAPRSAFATFDVENDDGTTTTHLVPRAPIAGAAGDTAPPDDAAELKLPQEWAALDGFFIMDPDGWRVEGAPSFNEPTTYADYSDRVFGSTVRPLTAIEIEARAAAGSSRPPTESEDS